MQLQPRCRMRHKPAEGAPALPVGWSWLLCLEIIPYPLILPFEFRSPRCPKLPWKKSFAHLFLVNCSGVMALHIKKISLKRQFCTMAPSSDEGTNHFRAEQKNTCLPDLSQNCSFLGLEDVQIRRILPSQFLFSRTWVCPKKPEESFLGHLRLWQSAVSQFHKEMHSGMTRAQWLYLHVPHMVRVHVLEIHGFDPSGHWMNKRNAKPSAAYARRTSQELLAFLQPRC